MIRDYYIKKVKRFIKMKKIIFLMSVVVLLFVVSCAPEITEKELDAELEELSNEELAELSVEEGSGAIAGEAIRKGGKLSTVSKSRVKKAARRVLTARPTATKCVDSDYSKGMSFSSYTMEKGTIKGIKKSTGKVITRDDFCRNTVELTEYYCYDGKYVGGKIVNCLDLGKGYYCNTVQDKCMKLNTKT
jgi:hypothetical protein